MNKQLLSIFKPHFTLGVWTSLHLQYTYMDKFSCSSTVWKTHTQILNILVIYQAPTQHLLLQIAMKATSGCVNCVQILDAPELILHASHCSNIPIEQLFKLEQFLSTAWGVWKQFPSFTIAMLFIEIMPQKRVYCPASFVDGRS